MRHDHEGCWRVAAAPEGPEGKGRCQKRFSGIRPLRGGGVPPFSAKEKNLLFFTLIFR